MYSNINICNYTSKIVPFLSGGLQVIWANFRKTLYLAICSKKGTKIVRIGKQFFVDFVDNKITNI